MGKAETVRKGKLGNIMLRLAKRDQRFFGLADGVICVEGDVADDVWRWLHDEAGKSNPKYFGFDGARARFLKFFPNGFHSAGFESQERNYKLAAKDKLDSTVPLEEAITGSGFGSAVMSVFQATNMLSPFEKARLKDVLKGPQGDHFVRATAKFAVDGDKSALAAMEAALKPQDCAKWTVATYLPFLWKPESHMFLKPEATKDFAERVGHRFAFDYEAGLKFDVYESLLDLADKTERELTDLNPADRIDIQSFIWVVGDYREDREDVYP